MFEGIAPVEERDTSGATVVKRFFGAGFQQGGVTFYWVQDHLGSVRDVTDSTGTLRARYDYDPFGRRPKVSGDVDADLGYTGHFFHAASTLHLAPRRGYDAAVARWISSDPSKSQGNLYAYVQNNPIRRVDILGLEQVSFTVKTVIRGHFLHPAPGQKSYQTAFVDTDTGKITHYMDSIGDTFGNAGVGWLNATSSGGQGCVTVTFTCSLTTLIGVPWDISYSLTFKYNAKTGTGRLSGSHDGYPSYEAYKDRMKIYDHPEGWIWQLAGGQDVTVDEPF